MHACTQTAENLLIPLDRDQATLKFALSHVVLEGRGAKQNSITHHIFSLYMEEMEIKK